MKRYFLVPGILVLIVLSISSCEDRKLLTQTANVPIYLSFEDLRKSIEVTDTAKIRRPGKIYFKDEYIFINEFMEGVHVVDISNPSAPTPVVYMPVPGNVDMAIKDNILYLDSYTDLVMIDITDPTSPVEHARIEDILEYTLPPYDPDFPLAEIDKEEGVVTGWKVEEYTREIENNPYPWPMYYEYSFDARLSSSVAPGSGGGASGSAYGVGGSMARFLTYDKYLYMLQTTNQLKVMDISNTESPVEKYNKYVGWGLETMFIYDGYMYLGARDGMYIMSLLDPKNPFTTAVYRHITSCDPVVVSGNLAYVTLRSGTMCGGTADLLEVINIADKYNPERIASYGMDEPYGLGISGSTLFICQGDNGLVVYDATNPLTIKNHQLAKFTNIKATDVIPVNNILFAIGDSGFYLYDYSDVNEITLLGSIEVEPED